MSISNRLIKLVPMLWGNPISLIGTTLATVAGNAFLILMVVDLVSGGINEYAAAMGYLMAPPVFVFGLLLIAWGVRRDRKRKKAPAEAIGQAIDLVWKDRKARRRVIFVVVATFLNITIVSVAAFQGISYMETPRFCGKLCHSVMKPEYRAYSLSPHARVACVDCHIGQGASWFVRSKLSGLRQVWAVTTGRFSRPIPTPIHNLRPARETCEHCHWPEKFHGERMLVRHGFKDDQANTRVTSAVRLKVGGVNKRTGRYEGIHWHVGPDVKVEYEALDGKRVKIGKITMTQGGRTEIYTSPETPAGAKVVERRAMDCVDCHNRPTHIYDASPESAVDKSMAWGKLDASLPFLKREAVRLLKGSVPGDPEKSAAFFEGELTAFYSKQHPEAAKAKAASIKYAGAELQAIYSRNVYPDLKITWGTYPSHLGHRRTTEGCFRCHDDKHKSSSGKLIKQDCDLCHEVMAEEDEKPSIPEDLLRLGGM